MMQRNVLDEVGAAVLGRRLQDARQARGLTQQQVAEELGAARTTVTALEKGERRIRPEELVRLAELYGRRIGDLLNERKPTEAFRMQFRRALLERDSNIVSDGLSEAVSQFESLCEDYVRLEELFDLQSPQQFPPDYRISGRNVEGDAEEVAESERNRLGLGDGPILNLQSVLEDDVGLRVFVMRLPSDVAGIFGYAEELGGCVATNDRHPMERSRFTLAHEYAHFLAGRGTSEVTMSDPVGRKPALERFADAFARHFLMAGSGLRRRFNQLLRASDGSPKVADIVRMAHQYVVSMHAMVLRLEELRLIRAGSWDRLQDQGLKVRDAQAYLGLSPAGQELDADLPLRYRLLAVRAYHDEEITEGQLAQFLRTDRIAARQLVRQLNGMAQQLDLSAAISPSRS